MASDTAQPGGGRRQPQPRTWLALGQMQFDFLDRARSSKQHRRLDIGCGNLRAGWRFIELRHRQLLRHRHLPGHPHRRQENAERLRLQQKLPHLTLTRDLTLEFLPSGHFDVVHAHSVFSHSPIEIIDQCLPTSAGS